MPASPTARLSVASATPASRTAGFVLGTGWPRPEGPAPESAAPEGRVPDHLPPATGHENASAIFQGIITHFVEPDLRPKLRESGEHLRLVEDLGLDSLAMIEVMLRVEDLLKIHISDAELRHFRTLGEVREFIDRKARSRPASASVGG
jgi:acyl carrier protein